MKITAINYLTALMLLPLGQVATGETGEESLTPVIPIPQEAEYLDGFFELGIGHISY